MNRSGQASAVGTGPLNCERQLLRAESKRPLERLLVTAAVGSERPVVQSATDRIQRWLAGWTGL